MFRSLIRLSLMDLLAMDHQTTCRVQLPWTVVAFEVLCFLMLQQD